MVQIFEKNPKENARQLVRCILDKGIDPNLLKIKYLVKNEKNEEVLDVSPLSFACMRY